MEIKSSDLLFYLRTKDAEIATAEMASQWDHKLRTKVMAALADFGNQLKLLSLNNSQIIEIFDSESFEIKYDTNRGIKIFDPFNQLNSDLYIDGDGWTHWTLEE